MVAAYAQARSMVAVAVKAAMSDVWGGREAEALRGVIAGDLPVPKDEGVGTKHRKAGAAGSKQGGKCDQAAARSGGGWEGSVE